MIKDMERAIFKRETIQLKYLPKVEKKNAEDRCKFFVTVNLNLHFSILRKIVAANCKLKANIEAYN